jgi:hypothetical protein
MMCLKALTLSRILEKVPRSKSVIDHYPGVEVVFSSSVIIPQFPSPGN